MTTAFVITTVLQTMNTITTAFVTVEFIDWFGSLVAEVGEY